MHGSMKILTVVTHSSLSLGNLLRHSHDFLDFSLGTFHKFNVNVEFIIRPSKPAKPRALHADQDA